MLRSTVFVLMVWVWSLASWAQLPLVETTLDDFESSARLTEPAVSHAQARVVPAGNGHALEVRFDADTPWPNVLFTSPLGAWNWGDQAGIALDVFNPELESLEVAMRVDNPGADGANHCITVRSSALPGRVTTLRALFSADARGPFWGMRGVPVLGPIGTSSTGIDPAQIVAFQVFLPSPVKPHTLRIDNIRLIKLSGPLDQVAPLPIVDTFGQYRHADWPGKVRTETELAERAAVEQTELATTPRMPDLDAFGGWTKGPALPATGWFRTMLLNGKWWLVTPDGHLFLSMGIDCIGTWDSTFVEKREPWFEWLPDPNDERFKPAYSRATHAHSMAEIINGEGRAFSFYRANLIRKYGADWSTRWCKISAERVRSWGFNTIGNWSQQEIIENSTLPFVAAVNIAGEFKRVEGGGGYWAKMADTYDPKFAESVTRCVANAVKPFAANPRCIGYFSDNEMAWEEVEHGVLASPVTQPARVAFIGTLQARYPAIDALNTAWGTQFADWDAVRAPATPSVVCQADLDTLVYGFAHHYFELVKNALKTAAPNQLYLGCRFASAPLQVVKACADVADVVSFNIYRPAVDRNEFAKSVAMRKPVLIGEFHVGALDRGMFHTGLVAAPDQNGRASTFVGYVRNVVDNPAVVGCHWFQYIDEPLTGRCFDGENYNIGFVSVTDTPYPEMVKAARAVFGDMYAQRIGPTR